VILHYFHSQERLQLLKNEGHIPCHTRGSAGRDRGSDTYNHTYT
jgi:hypothetical protein